MYKCVTKVFYLHNENHRASTPILTEELPGHAEITLRCPDSQFHQEPGCPDSQSHQGPCSQEKRLPPSRWTRPLAKHGENRRTRKKTTFVIIVYLAVNTVVDLSS